MDLPYEPTLSTPGDYPEKMKSVCQRDCCILMSITKAKNGNNNKNDLHIHSRMLLIHKRIKSKHL